MNSTFKPYLYYMLPLLLITGLCTTCITPLDQEPSGFEPYLVVDGFINNDFGPHEFKITRVTKFAGVLDGGAILALDATVTIIDQDGNRTPVAREDAIRKDLFNANPEGCNPAVNLVRFQTLHRTPSTFRGQVGNTYTLEIEIDGESYRSEPQTILPTPPIEELSVRFQQLPSLDEVVVPSGIEVFATWQDPPDEANYYSWVVNGIYQISTPDKGAGVCCIYDPRDGGVQNCWISERNIDGNELAFSDEDTQGQRTTLKVGFIQDDGFRFASRFLPPEKKYYVEVQQYQISAQAFEFYSRIKKLREIDGEIFDPFPLSVRGNIFNIADETEPVIGFFGAYSVQEKGIFVADSLFEFKQRFTNPCGDCRIRSGAQTETPEPFQ